MKGMLLILSIFMGLPLLAQPKDTEEIRETLRFIRLAETKKNLDFSDEKLLKLNEILDDYEGKHLKLRHQHFKILKQLHNANEMTEPQAKEIMDAHYENRTATHDLEKNLIGDVRAILNNQESVQFFKFYDRFQKKVKRRIRSLQSERGDGQRGKQRRPGMRRDQR